MAILPIHPGIECSHVPGTGYKARAPCAPSAYGRWMKRGERWSAILVVVAAIVVMSFVGYHLAGWPPGQEPAASPPRAGNSASTQEGARTGPGSKLAVLGDSFTAESSASAGPTWPKILADKLKWNVYTNAATGSGYVSAVGSQPFEPRVPAVLRHHPDVIIVAGGVADLGAYPADRIARAADEVVSRLVREAPEAKVVVVSPFSNGEPGPLTQELSAKLRKVAGDHGVAYVDATRWLEAGPVLFASDGTHPTEEGQQRLASQMEAALRELNLVQSPPGQAAAG